MQIIFVHTPAYWRAFLQMPQYGKGEYAGTGETRGIGGKIEVEVTREGEGQQVGAAVPPGNTLRKVTQFANERHSFTHIDTHAHTLNNP